MRQLVALALLASVLAAGCGLRAPARTVRSTAVIQQALIAAGADGSALFDPFPRTVGQAACKIGEGGPNPGRVVPGVCSTRVAAEGADEVVTFTEHWNARAFREAHSPATGQLSTTWQVTLDAAGRLLRTRQTGAFPPQDVM